MIGIFRPAVDTNESGLLQPDPASFRDRDGGRPLLETSRLLFPVIKRVFADSGYDHEHVATTTNIVVKIVNNLSNQVGFTVLPRRNVVERFSAWISRNRRLAKDPEATIESARASLSVASVILLGRRTARVSRVPKPTFGVWQTRLWTLFPDGAFAISYRRRCFVTSGLATDDGLSGLRSRIKLSCVRHED